MSDFLIIGSDGSAYNPEGSVDWNNSAEQGNYVTVVTRSFTPQGLEGDAVFRRAYVTIEHTSGIDLAVTPILDGERLTECAYYFSRPTPPVLEGLERYTFMVPLFRMVSGMPGSMGARGTTVQLEIASHSPVGEWHLENVGWMFSPGSRAKKAEA